MRTRAKTPGPVAPKELSARERVEARGCLYSPATTAKTFFNAIASVCKGKQSPGVVPARPRFANSCEMPSVEVPAGGLELLEDASNEGGWYRLASYREYPHPKGMQRVSRQAAEAAAARFNGAVSRIKRALGLGRHTLPVYRGHPDDPAMANEDRHLDTTRYGEVDGMEAREDGLYAHISWANEWSELKTQTRWRLSPRWSMSLSDPARNIYEPRKILSIGLTDRPNLPDAAFANEENKMNELLKKLLADLGFSNERIEATLSNGADAVSITEAASKLSGMHTALSNEQAEHKKTKDKLAAVETAKAEAKTGMANERQARAKLVVDQAVAAGKIKPAERASWEGKLKDADQWDDAANELAQQKSGIKTLSTTGDLGSRRETVSDFSNEFSALVNEQVKAGKPYDQAYAAVKVSAKGQDLIAKMREKAE